MHRSTSTNGLLLIHISRSRSPSNSSKIASRTCCRSLVSVTGWALPGIFPRTVHLRWNVIFGLAIILAYQPRVPGLPVIYILPSILKNQISIRRFAPVLRPMVVISIVRSCFSPSSICCSKVLVSLDES